RESELPHSWSTCFANFMEYRKSGELYGGHVGHVGQLQIKAKTATWKSPSALWAAEDLWCRMKWRMYEDIYIELRTHMWMWGSAAEDATVAVGATFQKTTNNKKQFLRLPASGNSSQKALKTEIKGINAMQVANALTSFLLKERHGRRWGTNQIQMEQPAFLSPMDPSVPPLPY
ncbi:hypothetical protein STEG23_032804, partial [Scotinomys teguina]